MHFNNHRQPPNSKMENLIPSDVWRSHVLPCLDVRSRIAMNRTLDPETRFAKSRRADYAKIAETMAIRSAGIILDRIERSVGLLNRVKGVLHLFMFLQTGIGRMMLKHKNFRNMVLIKIAQFEHRFPDPKWWNRSPYRKKLRVAMERLRDIILTAA